MSEHYVLEADHSVRPAELMEWATFLGDRDKRRVAIDKIGEVTISTVFLGLNHSFDEGGPPLIFETLVSGGGYDEDMWRYSTWDESVAGHAAAVALVQGQSK